MELAKHVMTNSFGLEKVYEISDADVTGVRIVTPRVTHDDGSVTEEVRKEINLSLEFVCCTPERFRVNVTQYNY
jgi:hypothetical protein